MNIVYGSYTGNGVDNRSITGIGFTPELVIIKGDTTQHAVFKTTSLSGDNTLPLAQSAGAFADGIQSLDSDGFTLGTNATVNSNSVTYYWIAVRAASDGDFKEGTYTGDGVDNRNITGIGFQPSIVVIKANSVAIGRMRDSSDTLEQTHMLNDNYLTENEIQALQTDGFQVGTSTGVNGNGTAYYWFAFRADTGEITINSYNGNGTDDRDITGIGFVPDMVWIFNAFDGDIYPGADAILKTSSMAGDSTFLFANSSSVTNRIQALQTDGFQVGTDQDANSSLGTYHYLAFENLPAGTTTSTSTSTTTSSST